MYLALHFSDAKCHLTMSLSEEKAHLAHCFQTALVQAFKRCFYPKATSIMTEQIWIAFEEAWLKGPWAATW